MLPKGWHEYALAREQALSGSLRAELEAAYVSRATAERSATQRLEELNSLRGVLHKIQSDMRVSISQARTKATAGAKGGGEGEVGTGEACSNS